MISLDLEEDVDGMADALGSISVGHLPDQEDVKACASRPCGARFVSCG